MDLKLNSDINVKIRIIQEINCFFLTLLLVLIILELISTYMNKNLIIYKEDISQTILPISFFLKNYIKLYYDSKNGRERVIFEGGENSIIPTVYFDLSIFDLTCLSINNFIISPLFIIRHSNVGK